MQLDKDELLAAGKYFGRIFLAYLMSHPEYTTHASRETLAQELIAIGQSEKLATSTNLNAGSLHAMNVGKQRLTHWVSYSLLRKAISKGFRPTHPADSLGIAISMYDSFKKNHDTPLTKETIYTYFLFIADELSIDIPEKHHDVIFSHFTRKRLLT